ncbi:MAG: alpha/beta hydrolase [Urechidicola sp.]|nr:alpha/beta hydrolase [Urechidicola sp.]
MKNNILISICLLAIFSVCHKSYATEKNSKGALAKEISFMTSDGIKIFGDLYEINKTNPVILLFHQGGSNARGEYASIIPKLIDMGFNILAIDQRVGGQYYGKYNRTLANIPTNGYGDGYGYCDAYNNLESTLEYIIESGFTGNKILWGSSYSASLAIQLANKNQDEVNGVLAFSPASGGSMKDCLPNPYFETLKVPLLLLRPPHEMENKNAKAQFELAKANGHQTYAAKHGVHGSSMLVKERVEGDVSETWRVVTTFLKQYK